MRNVKVVLFVLLVVILSMSTYGQVKKEVEQKVAIAKLPVEVKKEIGSLKGYNIKSASFKMENDTKVYIVEIEKGKMKHHLILDENGKIIGRQEE